MPACLCDKQASPQAVGELPMGQRAGSVLVVAHHLDGDPDVIALDDGEVDVAGPSLHRETPLRVHCPQIKPADARQHLAHEPFLPWRAEPPVVLLDEPFYVAHTWILGLGVHRILPGSPCTAATPDTRRTSRDGYGIGCEN